MEYPSLNGLRGIAVLLVMAYHFTSGAVPQQSFDQFVLGVAGSGWLGVDLFFVLSGFLITGILLDTPRTEGRLRNFYLRRALRIVPAYYGMLLLFLVVAPVLHQGATAEQLSGSVRAHAIPLFTYTINLAVAVGGPSAAPFFGPHFWSLAIEEQFYLFWPILILGATVRTAWRWCVSTLVFSAVLRAAFVVSGVSAVTTYVFTFTRLDGLALGGLLACAMRMPEPGARRTRRLQQACLAALAIVIAGVVRGGQLDPYAPWTLAATIVAAGVLFAEAVRRAVAADRAAHRTFLRHPALVLTGRYSYGMYLFHFPVIVLLSRAHVDVNSVGTIAGSALPGVALYCVLAGTITTLLAIISWRLVESPLLSLKKFVPR